MSTPTRWPALSVRITLIDVRSITFLRDIAHIANISPAYRPSDTRKNYCEVELQKPLRSPTTELLRLRSVIWLSARDQVPAYRSLSTLYANIITVSFLRFPPAKHTGPFLPLGRKCNR